MTSAIYYQKSNVVQEEFKLIEITTLRELEVEKLQKVIREVKERRRDCDDAAILETFTLFNRVRDTTVELIKVISVWQESFTKPIRPQLLDCDYIIVRLINHIDFVNSTVLKRQFNFQFYRGNVLLLPYSNPKTVEPVRISTVLAREIKKFAAPSEETVVFCYQFLINCLPKEIYENKVAPLKRWLMQSWVPRVWVLDVKPQVVPPPPLRKQTSASTLDTRRGSRVSSSTSEDAKATSRLSRRRSTLGSGSMKGTGGNQATPQASDTPATPITKMKRRNQMQADEVALANNLVIQPDSPVDLEKDFQAQQLEEYARQEQVKREKEAAQLDTYFKEMELLFLPTLGRRAVQTIGVGGTRLGVEMNLQDLFHQPEKIVFHHSLKEDQDKLAQVVQSNIIPADAKRTNAEIVAKRNRIMTDRSGKPSSGIQYMTASGKRFPTAAAAGAGAAAAAGAGAAVQKEAHAVDIQHSADANIVIDETSTPISTEKETMVEGQPRLGSTPANDKQQEKEKDNTENEANALPPLSVMSATTPPPASPAPLSSALAAPLVGILFNPGPLGEQGVNSSSFGGAASDEVGGVGVETAEARKARRRESRRISDLTITFSLNEGLGGGGGGGGGEYGDDGDLGEQDYYRSNNGNKSVSPKKGKSGRNNAFSTRTGSPSKKNSQSVGIASHNSPSNKGSAAASSPNYATQSQKTPPSGLRRRTDSKGVAGTNIYGNRIRAETPPPASATLSLSTKDMRLWFAQQEQLDVHSQSTY